MTYDDETGGGAQYDVGDDRGAPAPRPAQLPSPELRREIVKLGRKPGWNAERVQRQLYEDRKNVPLDAVRYILGQADAG
ncbi:hypothetical protein SK854_23060 [Lentzea sp. BCCO 10_0061]|uniref:Uncharacterized protein n=1 Tax=Lentzea sokolovensis TaxID=3095429 RepID=A0ABU4V1X5_9PSEU|nr:hypothetical protein [Lentzea sp. BCCO 10_0061]MDX8145008.1 hypothetical protein [Lentzea sp. BCCO 10_0061]